MKLGWYVCLGPNPRLEALQIWLKNLWQFRIFPRRLFFWRAVNMQYIRAKLLGLAFSHMCQNAPSDWTGEQAYPTPLPSASFDQKSYRCEKA